MERPVKIILYIITAILVINLLISLFGNSNIRSIRQDLEQAKRHSDSALNELRFSKAKLDSIRTDMVIFKAYIDRVETIVSLNDAEKRFREEKDSKKRDSLLIKIKEHREELAMDTVPEIHIVSIHR
jgi:hypothetical protein